MTSSPQGALRSINSNAVFVLTTTRMNLENIRPGESGQTRGPTPVVCAYKCPEEASPQRQSRKQTRGWQDEVWETTVNGVEIRGVQLSEGPSRTLHAGHLTLYFQQRRGRV